MARTDLSIPTLGRKFVDLRDSIPGDSYNWSWVRSLSQVNYLAIHHTAGPDTQTPEQIANFHINSNSWGGIGYHFLIAKDGAVYYVGDISTARANVANLNDQVLGICLIGNFTQGRLPTNEQLDSAHKLCDFFISHFPDLSNVNSWASVRGHKELPGQSTACPGDNWLSWRIQIVEGIIPDETPQPPTPTPPISDRGAQITESYRTVLGRDPDMGGLQTYTNGPLTLDEIMASMVNSGEHRRLIENAKQAEGLKSQVDSLQTSLASLNQQVIFLQETLLERDRQISSAPTLSPKQKGNTLTIVDALINLYKFIFPPRKES